MLYCFVTKHITICWVIISKYRNSFIYSFINSIYIKFITVSNRLKSVEKCQNLCCTTHCGRTKVGTIHILHKRIFGIFGLASLLMQACFKAHPLSKKFCTMIPFSKNDSWCQLWLGWKGLVRMIPFSKMKIVQNCILNE